MADDHCRVKSKVEEYILLKVQHPRTHIGKHQWPKYTDYEIYISTNSMMFTRPTSKVRRRFSEFQWLRKKLLEHCAMLQEPPQLPPKKLVGRFKKDFIQSRCIALQDFLEKVTSVVSYLSSTALHMFLQTKLSLKEMEYVLEGKDQRDVTDILKDCESCEFMKGDDTQSNLDNNERPQQSVSESGYISLSRSNSLLSAGLESDSLNACSIMKALSVSQGHGNGWSSGVKCPNNPAQNVPCKGFVSPSGPGPLSGQRRMTLHHDAASVLPTGEILVPEYRDKDGQTPCQSDLSGCSNIISNISGHGEKCYNYDADDEKDFEITDFVKTQKLFRVRRWLNSFSTEGYCMCDSSSSEENFGRPVVTARHLKEYDVLSTGSLMFTDPIPLRQVSTYSDCNDLSDNGSDNTYDSGFSIVHSSIDSLELMVKPERVDPSTSEGSLNSAEVYGTYDVVEMIELK